MTPALQGAVERIVASGDQITSRSGGPPVAGWVRTPDGNPAKEAKVFMLGHYRRLSIRNCEQVLHADCTAGKTDRAGRYSFPTSPEIEWDLVLVHPSGYLVVDGKARREATGLRLRPWGTVEGVCRIGGAPVEGASMRAETSLRDFMMETPCISHTIEAKTDGDGRFAFARVPPGKLKVGAVRSYGMHHTGSSHSRKIVVASGKTTAVQIGGDGRPVVGRAAVPPGTKVAGHWQRSYRSLHARAGVPVERPAPPPIQRWREEARQEAMRGVPTDGMSKETQEMLTSLAAVENGERKELLVGLYVVARMAERVAAWQATPEQKAYRETYARYEEACRKARDVLEHSSFAVAVDGQGRFRIEDVPAGDYELKIVWYGSERQRSSLGMAVTDYDTLCTLQHTFTVPPIPGGKSDEPLDLGTLAVALASASQPGAVRNGQ